MKLCQEAWRTGVREAAMTNSVLVRAKTFQNSSIHYTWQICEHTAIVLVHKRHCCGMYQSSPMRVPGARSKRIVKWWNKSDIYVTIQKVIGTNENNRKGQICFDFRRRFERSHFNRRGDSLGKLIYRYCRESGVNLLRRICWSRGYLKTKTFGLIWAFKGFQGHLRIKRRFNISWQMNFSSEAEEWFRK